MKSVSHSGVVFTFEFSFVMTRVFLSGVVFTLEFSFVKKVFLDLELSLL